jgi:hypothetical protein
MRNINDDASGIAYDAEMKKPRPHRRFALPRKYFSMEGVESTPL